MSTIEKPEQVCESCEQEPAVPAEATKQTVPSLVEDVLDPSTFLPPNIPSIAPAIVIEFCDRCRWLHRATWIQTELFLTFPPPVLECITLIPRNTPGTGGRFRVWLSASVKKNENVNCPSLIWDRKTRGGFPELKVLKQLIRDRIQPSLSLGHSDRKVNTSEVI